MLNIQLRTRFLNIIKLRLLDALFVRPFSFHHFDFALYFRVTRTCTNIHIGDTRIQVTEHRRSACGDVSVILPHRTVSPSWCLARLPPDVSGHCTGTQPLSPPLHCTVGQEAVFYHVSLCFMDDRWLVCVSCGDVDMLSGETFPSLWELDLNNRTSRTMCVIGRQKNLRFILINWYFPEVTDKRQSVN